MMGEKKRKVWYVINRRPKVIAQKETVDGVAYSTCKGDTEYIIFDSIHYRFYIANNAPISKTLLLEQLGYLAGTEIDQKIVEGRYGIPGEVDNSTLMIIEEIGRIGIQLRSGNIVIEIISEEFKYF